MNEIDPIDLVRDEIKAVLANIKAELHNIQNHLYTSTEQDLEEKLAVLRFVNKGLK